MTTKETFQLINLHEQSRLIHSRFYPLAPIGLGTTQVESLTSYVVRLAYHHNIPVSQLISEEISPFLTHNYLNKEKTNTNNLNAASAMLGSGTNTVKEWLIALKQLTQRNDLRYLTTDLFHGMISNKNLIHAYRRWCPQCYESCRNQNMEVYDQLIWAFHNINICPIHLRPLQQDCPHCGKKSGHLRANLIPGHCPFCKKWLGHSVDLDGVPQDYEEITFYPKQVGSLLEAAPSLSIQPDGTNISLFIQYLVDKRMKEKSFRSLGKLLKVHHTVVTSWINKDYSPMLGHLLYACKLFKINLLDVATMDFEHQEETEIIDSSGPQQSAVVPFCPTRKQSSLPWNQILSDMRLVAEGRAEPLTVEQIAAKHNASPSSLYAKAPDLCKHITTTYATHSDLVREEKDRELYNDILLYMQKNHRRGKKTTKLMVYLKFGGRSDKKSNFIDKAILDIKNNFLYYP